MRRVGGWRHTETKRLVVATTNKPLARPAKGTDAELRRRYANEASERERERERETLMNVSIERLSCQCQVENNVFARRDFKRKIRANTRLARGERRPIQSSRREESRRNFSR